MPKPDQSRVGAPCWIDLATSDPDKSRAFYEALLGWTSEDAGEDYGHYINFSKDGQGVAGGMKNSGDMGMPDGWSIYLQTADVDKLAEVVTANGGQVVVPPMDVMTLGRMSFVTDPGGAMIGAWQPGDHKGFEVVAEVGAPGWFELLARDYDKSVAFYREVFGWETHTMSDGPDVRYTTLFADEAAAAGIMDAAGMLPEGVPAHWSVYFVVADTDAAVAKATELGGTLVQPAEDTPHGRMATLTDVTGGMFKVVSAVES